MTESRSSLQSTNPLRVSVAMCTFNGAEYIGMQLRSILHQTYPVCQIVICDDGSDDRTIDIVHRTLQNAAMSFIVIENPSRLGTSANFEQAIGLCTGDLIALADQDDLWFPNKIEVITSAFRDKPYIGGIFTDAVIIDEASQSLKITLWKRYRITKSIRHQLRSGDFVSVLLKRPVITGATLVFRASLIPQLLPVPTPWLHDAWLAWKISLHSHLSPLESHEQMMAYRCHRSQQIGLPPDLVERIRNVLRWLHEGSSGAAKARVAREYRNQVIELGLLNEPSGKDLSAVSSLFLAIMEKVAFCRLMTMALTESRVRRFPSVISSWRQYLRFTPSGAHSLIRDLLL
jgi:glycosyltransferase involved in cell wall biosynthesis